MNVLVVAPHPDDEVIGCGGSILRHNGRGNTVSVLYLTSGESGDKGTPKPDLARIREQEARTGATVLGVSECTFLRLPDGGIPDGGEALIAVGSYLRAAKPDIVYLPHPGDGHRDHRAAYRLVTEALYRAGSHAYQELSGTPWTSGTVLLYEVWTPMTEITYTEDVSSVIDRKIRALEAHTSQLANVRYDEAVLGFNRYRGVMTGKGEYCECFRIVKTDRLFNPEG